MIEREINMKQKDEEKRKVMLVVLTFMAVLSKTFKISSVTVFRLATYMLLFPSKRSYWILVLRYAFADLIPFRDLLMLKFKLLFTNHVLTQYNLCVCVCVCVCLCGVCVCVWGGIILPSPVGFPLITQKR